MNEHENCHVEPLEKPLDQAALSTAMVAYLAVRGMGCPRCAMRVHNGLLSLDGVLLANVFLEEGITVVAYDPDQVAVGDLVMAVASAGNDGRHHYQARGISLVPAAQVLSL